LDEALGAYAHLGRLRPVGHLGDSGRAWLVEAGRRRFVLRRLPPALSLAQAGFAAAVQHRVAEAGGPATPVVADTSGRLVVTAGGQPYMMVVYAPGECLPDAVPGPGLCREFGRTLGRLHRCLRSCPELADRAPPDRHGPDPVAELTGALSRHGPGCPHPEARRVLAAKLARAEGLSAQAWALFRRRPDTVIHGDFHLGNIVIEDRRVGTVLDYDIARRCAQGYEVVRGLLYCAKPAGGYPAFASRVRAFLAGYFEVAPLPEEEVARMVELFRTVQVLDPYGLGACTGASDGLVRFGLARFSLLRWVEVYGAVLTSLAVEACQGTSPRRRR
jgi:Ser/Thr protein kinase RdoA (MazF antagonist)